MIRRFAVLIVLSVFGTTVDACNIPVFRYALERWRPDPCEVFVFYEGHLTGDEETILRDALPDRVSDSTSGSGDDPVAKLVRCNIRTLDSNAQSLWSQVKKQGEPTLPHVVVRVNLGGARFVNGWQGGLRSLEDHGVFKSPSRHEMSRRLLSGDSVVWLLMTGKDTDQAAHARKMLREELPKLAEQVQLPEGIGLPGSELYSDVPLLVRFSFLEISRDDPKERFLVELLSEIRPDAVARGEPIAVPIFGRGRALEVIPVGDLNPSLMADLTLFLSGACSCQVKDQNPGFDLLFDANWNGELFEEGFKPPPAKSGGQNRRPELLDIPPGR
ncbi:hypothetical protein OAA27_00845 [bacterium]|nr:hypothetical protein [Rubripirellula sp.]MDB4331594.1 hypothetical protein [bacterium]MDB4338725.1 hypothetical protein [Rubripirellula sp.]